MKKDIWLAIFVAMILVFSSIQPASAATTIIYVDIDATGSSDGTSWEDAYPLLQMALDEASAQPGTDIEIWVAEGTYYPDDGPGHVQDSRDESFRIQYNNVQLYGGFAGTELIREARDWSSNVTILSGDIGTSGTSSDNSYHVLYLDGVTNTPINAKTVIDGFTITGGSASGSDSNGMGGGLYCAGSGSGHACSPGLANLIFYKNSANYKGAGMYNNGTNGGTVSPILREVTFDANWMENYASAGAGMYNDGSNIGRSNPQLFQVTFSNNALFGGGGKGGGMVNDGSAGGLSSPSLTAVLFTENFSETGGGVYNNGTAGVSSPALTDVTFSRNFSLNGGGMYTDGTGGVAKPTLKNVKFSDNYGNGGGMYNLNSNPRLLNALFNHNCTSNTYGGGIYNNHSNAVLMNVTLVSNGFCTDYGNACLAGGGIYNDHSNPQLTNTILWSNTAIAGTQISNTVGSVPKIYYSDIEGGCPSGSNCVAGMIDADPLFVDAGASNYRLSSSSPAVDAGNNAYMSLSIDLAGKPRKVDLYRTDTGSGTPPIVDMGAYETQADVIYVDQDATGGLNNGLTWANAYTDLADALTWANDNPGVYLEIWVAEGVYTPGSDRSASFQISRDHVQLYGGFSGSENIREQRDWAAHLTSLSGDIGTQGDSADNSYHVLYLDGVTTQPLGSLTVIDGFTITGGYASESSGANAKGGGLYCAGSGAGHACSPTLANLIFSANAAIQGSGVYADGSAGGASSPRIEQVIFRDNSANEGGGMYNDGGNGGASNPSIEATLFNGNQADSAGGGMYNNGGNSGSSLPTLINVTFSGNQAGVSGGGMYNYGVSGEARPRLVNCILWGNDAPDSPQISNQSATPAITYTDIEGGGYPDTGNLQTDPLFNAPALASTAPTAAGDYHVQAISPVIDAGNSISPTIESDLDGNPRLTGAEVDMGAYEAALVYTLTLSTNGNGSGVITPTAGIYSYFQNTVVTLTAEADNGMLFSGWSGSNDCHYGRVTMVADLACVATFNHAIIHVKQDAPGPVHDGITWETAYQTLQEALDLTNSNPGGVFEIWVAEGVYYPDEGGSHVNNSRSESFRINFNVRLYGGFAGNETSRDQSDWMANPTLLSGDIEQDETLANNAYHVIYVDGVSYNQSIGGTTVIDGFTITAGNAAGSGTDGSGGGMYCYSKRGYACDPSLSHLIFSGNSAAQDGGAIFADGGKISCEDNNSSGESSPTLSDVIITGNTANRGGGMANYAACYGRSSPSLSNVLFSQNSAVYGGAMFNYAKGSYLFIYVTPSLIIYMEYKAYSEPVLTNVTFSDNSASGNGGAIYNQLGVDPDTLFGTVSPTLNNSILWDNTAPSGAQIYNGGLHLFDKGATTSLYHSDLQGVGCDYCFGTGNIAVDPHFVDPAASDYRLKGESPLIDAGEDSECASEDIRDLPRNDWSCDMGAYEVHLVDSTVITKTTALSGTYTFGPTLVKMDFSDVGALITTTVEYWPGPHPYPVGSLGGSGVGWGPYYTLSGQGSSGVVTSGFGMTLTLSAEGINLPFVCKNTSRTWDCAVDGYNEDFAWRSGVSAFSDWAVGSDMDWIYLFLPLVAR